MTAIKLRLIPNDGHKLIVKNIHKLILKDIYKLGLILKDVHTLRFNLDYRIKLSDFFK